jgi:ABC-type multidrug transport system fused ATPase/permease subunit
MSAEELLAGVSGTPERLDGFLKTDAKITASLNAKFKSKKLSPRSVLKCIMQVAGPESPILCGAALWLVIGSTAKLISTNSQARMMAAVVSAAVGANPTAGPEFRRHLKTMVGASLVAAVTSGFRIWASAKAEVLTVARLKRMLFTSLLAKDIATFDTEGTGELMSRLSSDVTIIGTVLSTNVNIVLQQSFTLFGSLISLYRLSPRLALCYVLISAVWVTCTKKFGRYQQTLQRTVLGADASMSGVAEQAISMIRLVRTSGTEWFEREKYDVVFFSLTRAPAMAMDLLLLLILLPPPTSPLPAAWAASQLLMRPQQLARSFLRRDVLTVLLFSFF